MALVQIETKKTLWSSVLNTMLAWTKASRWRKASKCKSLIKQVQLHLSILKNRRDAIIRQSRADIAQLLQNGQLQQALDRVVQLYKDQHLMSAYDQINHFCLYIITNLSHIKKHSSAQSLPIEVGEAVSTLIFAASRCGELPELHMLRSLFKDRYGYKFEITNVELLPGNLVNFQIQQNLCINSVPDDVKLNLISEISREFTLNLECKSHEQSVKPEVYCVSYERCKSEQKAEVLDIEVHDMCSDSDESYIEPSKLKDMLTISSHSHGDLNGTSGSNSHTPIKKNATLMENKGASSAGTSGNGAPRIYENSIVYLDNLEKKSLKREGGGSKNVPNSSRNARTGSNVTKNSATKGSTRKPEIPGSQHCRSSTEEPLNKYHCNKLRNNRFSLDGSIDRYKTQEGGSSCSSHVHPKLPEYEDVVSKLADLKAENRQRRRFSYH